VSTAKQVPQSERLLEEADGFFDSRQREQALATYEFAMVAADTEKDAGRWVEATAQIAHVHVLEGDLVAAEEWIQRSAERLESGAGSARARWLIAEGALERARGEAGAEGRFAEAFAIASAERIWERAIQAAYMASLTAEGDERVEWARRALEICETARRADWVGALEMVVARELEAAGKLQEAVESYRSARMHLAAQGNRMDAAAAGVASVRCLRTAGQLDEARFEVDAVGPELEAGYAQLGGQWRAELLVKLRMEEARLELARGSIERASQALLEGRKILRNAGLDRAVPPLALEVEKLCVQMGVSN
jgi:hypothetical protein